MSLLPRQPRAAARRFPCVSLLLGALACALHAVSSTTANAFRPGDPNLLDAFTSHWFHWSPEHLLWSGGAFVLIAAYIERESRTCMIGLTVISSLVVAGCVAWFPAAITRYAGLSGVDSALFGYLIFLHLIGDSNAPPSERILAAIFGIGFVAKVAFEAATGHAIFVRETADMAVVPVAHLAGIVTGVAFAAGYPIVNFVKMCTQNAYRHTFLDYS